MITTINLSSGRRLGHTSALPAVARTPEGRALGGIPGALATLDPAYPVASGFGLRNRRQKAPAGFATSSALTAANFAAFPNGQPAFLVNSDTNFRLLGAVNLNPDALTWWSVLSWEPIASPTDFTNLTRGATVNTDLNPQLIIRRAGSQFALTNSNSSVTRCTTEESPFAGATPVLLMLTVSKRGGIKIYRNGQLVAQNAADKSGFTAQYSANQYSLFRGKADAGSVLKAGLTEIYGIDLSLPENETYRKSIEGYAMSLYGIAA